MKVLGILQKLDQHLESKSRNPAIDGWTNVKDGLPNNKNMFCLFIQWSENGGVITEYAGKYEDVLNFRSYDLKHNYTHWMQIHPPPTLIKK